MWCHTMKQTTAVYLPCKCMGGSGCMKKLRSNLQCATLYHWDRWGVQAESGVYLERHDRANAALFTISKPACPQFRVHCFESCGHRSDKLQQ